jgi:hypothetical protein
MGSLQQPRSLSYMARVSDFTGLMIEDESQAARVVVEQHPDFDEPITLGAS